MKNNKNYGLAIALSAGIGTAIGVAMENVTMGIGMGIVISFAIIAGINRKSKNNKNS